MGKRIIKVVVWRGCAIENNQCIGVDSLCVREQSKWWCGRDEELHCFIDGLCCYYCYMSKFLTKPTSLPCSENVQILLTQLSGTCAYT